MKLNALVTCLVASGMAMQAAAFDYYQPDEGGIAITPEEARDNPWRAARSDPAPPLEAGGDQQQYDLEEDRARVEARFVNPRPDLGCMYYDESGRRHWWPRCREL